MIQEHSRLSVSDGENHRSRNLLIRFIVGGTTLVVSISAYFSYQAARNMTLQDLRQSAFLEVQRGGDEIEEWLHVRQVEVETLANTPTVRSLTWSIAEPYLTAEVNRIKEFFFFQMVNLDGSFANTKVGPSNKNIKDRDFFQKAIAGKSNISDPFISRSTGIPLIAIATPIWATTPPVGSPIGVFHGNVKVDHIQEVVNSLYYGPNSYAFALNSQGQAIVHPNSALMSTIEKPAPSLLKIGDRNLNAIAQRMVNKKQGIELMEIDGTQKYVAYLPLKSANWSVALVIPRQNIESRLQFLDAIALIVGGLTVTMITVLWRVQAFEQAELKKSKAAADTANLAKSEFLANMSHELRTPLNGILGCAQILLRSPALPESEQYHVNIIEQCGSHLLTLINDILDLSKIEAKKLELHPQDVHLPSFLQGIAEICQIRAKQKGILFIYEPASNLPTGVHVDVKRLRQVLLNLLGNGIKFTDAGKVTFKVEVIDQPPSDEQIVKHQIHFTVEDTGIGITPAELSKIFLPFEQVGDKKRQAEGTGLGLAITRQLVQMMDSDIHVQSQIGEGSSFYFELEIPTAHDWVQSAMTISDKQIIGFAGEPYTILMVDDRWENRTVITNLLQPLGFNVVEATNGKEGLEKAIALQPNLIITDLLMPEMDGFELIQNLRQTPEIQDVKIIVSSASVFEADQYRSLQAGGNDFLSKPVQADELLQQLASHLNIVWIYKQSQTEVTAKESTTANSQSPQLTPPSTEVLQELITLASKGNFNAILKWADQLEDTDIIFAPFANELRQLARQFDEDLILNFLHQYAVEKV
ncbi:multi-sensor hybrid histidine kinase [Tolypothrix tenuis PCC 7101]|uniref:Circadian input-output histidine kinase CikA n=1 Tax=Tolypothrix tenuis PCC 7101 TaxID=231146 RepID=A0A1Z4MW09_9CYAN|nr:response regulator [Aulosira sp. FACHB-113]BAY97679.1 multi-sensor hybrid histidine kinase [Tolypothrix tenuis PCC 7101]BAZ71814.1 multi-sensor hybrid histidine kinase [Aulosira laxa NIES-50]